MVMEGRPRGRQERVVGGRYLLTERLGAGGMGAVWAGRDLLVDRDVAVKEAYVPGSRTAGSGSAEGPEGTGHTLPAALTERILREARAAARVDHPSVVTVHDVVVEDGHPWIVMERVRGESLEDRLQRERALPEREAARIALAVAEALRAAHARGVLHRDVKPGNVLLDTATGRVVLTDFGIAYIEGDEPLTRSGEFIGSLEYTAPERMGGSRPGPPSDLWSLGVLLFRMLEGSSPFRRESLEATVTAVVLAELPRSANSGRLGALVGELLVREPQARPSADEVAAALRAVVDPAPVPVRPRRWATPRRVTVAGVAVAVLGAGVPLGLSLWDGDGDEPRAQRSGGPTGSAPASTPAAAASAGKPGQEDGFTIAVPVGWQRKPGRAAGQYRYEGPGGFELIVVPGRDSVAKYGGDPMTYQRDGERELEPFRASEWATSSGLRRVGTGPGSFVEGQFTWQEKGGREVFVRNRVLRAGDAYHVVFVSGPEDSRDDISRVYEAACTSYRPKK
jgi:hypothetical protein